MTKPKGASCSIKSLSQDVSIEARMVRFPNADTKSQRHHLRCSYFSLFLHQVLKEIKGKERRRRDLELFDILLLDHKFCTLVQHRHGRAANITM